MSDFWRRAHGDDRYVESIRQREKRDQLRESLQHAVKNIIRTHIQKEENRTQLSLLLQHEGNVTSAAGLWPGALETIFRHEFTGRNLHVVVDAIFSGGSSPLGALVVSGTSSSAQPFQVGSASVLGAVGTNAVRNSLTILNTQINRSNTERVSEEQHAQVDALRCMSSIASALNRSQMATLLESLLNESSVAAMVVKREYSEKAFLRQQEEVGFMIALLHSLDPLPFVLPTKPPQIYELLPPPNSTSGSSTLSLPPSLSSNGSSNGGSSDAVLLSTGSSSSSDGALTAKKKVVRKKVAVITDFDNSKKGNNNSKSSGATNDDEFWNIEAAVLQPASTAIATSVSAPIVTTSPRPAENPSVSISDNASFGLPLLNVTPNASTSPQQISSIPERRSSSTEEQAIRAAEAAAALLENLHDIDAVLPSTTRSSAAVTVSATESQQSRSVASTSSNDSVRSEWERLVSEQKKRIEQELQEALEKEKAASERIRQQRERERLEQERIEAERLEKERSEREAIERERLAREREERERIERKREDQERLELLEKEKAERAERLKREAEQREREEREAEEKRQRELATQLEEEQKEEEEQKRAQLRAAASAQWVEEVARMQAEVRLRIEREAAAQKAQMEQMQTMQKALAASSQPQATTTSKSDGAGATTEKTPNLATSVDTAVPVSPRQPTSGVAAAVLAGVLRATKPSNNSAVLSDPQINNSASSSSSSSSTSNSAANDMDIASVLQLTKASATASPLKPSTTPKVLPSNTANLKKVRQSLAPNAVSPRGNFDESSTMENEDENDAEIERALAPSGKTAVQSVLSVGGDGFSFFEEDDDLADSTDGSSGMRQQKLVDTSMMQFRRTARVAADHSDLFSLALSTFAKTSAAAVGSANTSSSNVLAASRAPSSGTTASSSSVSIPVSSKSNSEITMEPLSANLLGASPETSALNVSKMSPSSQMMATASRSRFQSSALEEAKQQGFTWMPPRKQLYFTLEKRYTVEQQEFLCAVCGAVMLEEKARRYCEYLNRWCCLDCHLDDKYYIPARILHHWDFKQFSVSLFAYSFLVSVHKEPVFDLQAINPAIYLKDSLLSTALAFRRKLNVMKNYVLTCRDQGSLMSSLSKLSLQQHMVTATDLYSLKDLLEVKKGSLPNALKSLFQQWSAHFQKCELCKARRMLCEICGGKEGLFFPWEKNLSKCTKCGSHYHRKCAQGKSCPKCERIARRATNTTKLNSTM